MSNACSSGSAAILPAATFAYNDDFTLWKASPPLNRYLPWLIIAGMAIGALAGASLHSSGSPETVMDSATYEAFDGLAEIFLRLLRMVVIPLVFFSLLMGMVGMGDVTRLGRLGLKTFALYILTSMLALLVGVVLVNVVQPGVGLDLQIPTDPVEYMPPDSPWDFVLNVIPTNPVEAAANFDMIGVIVFALFFGAFAVSLPEHKRKPLTALVDAIADIMMRMTAFVIALAPVGIGALIARMVASTGLGVFMEMRWYVVVVFVGLATHILVTLPTLIYLFTRINPYRYLRTMMPALFTAFSTASSVGTLGVTLERVEKGAGVSNRVSSFVLPVGATVNMDGTALYEIVTVIFIAQVHAGIDPNFALTIGQQFLIVFLGLAVSIGAAGIPHAGLVMMVIILEAVGLPIEYTGLIWAVDRVLDMLRTMTNVASDSSVTLIVADSENEIDRAVLRDFST